MVPSDAVGGVDVVEVDGLVLQIWVLELAVRIFLFFPKWILGPWSDATMEFGEGKVLVVVHLAWSCSLADDGERQKGKRNR